MAPFRASSWSEPPAASSPPLAGTSEDESSSSSAGAAPRDGIGDIGIAGLALRALHPPFLHAALGGDRMRKRGGDPGFTLSFGSHLFHHFTPWFWVRHPVACPGCYLTPESGEDAYAPLSLGAELPLETAALFAALFVGNGTEAQHRCFLLSTKRKKASTRTGYRTEASSESLAFCLKTVERPTKQFQYKHYRTDGCMSSLFSVHAFPATAFSKGHTPG